MPEFICKVADASGRVFEEREAAQSPQEARQRLSERGLLVYTVDSRGGALGAAMPAFARGKGRVVGGTDFLIFNQQFVTLIRAGLTILKALDLLVERAAAPRLRPMLRDVRDAVREGALLSEAFEKQGMFDRVYTTSILAGERSGNLVGVLESYIAYQRVTSGLKKKLIAALIYPCILITAASLILTYIATYVIPQFGRLYSEMNIDLPWITQVMTQLATDYRFYVLAVVGLIVFSAFAALIWSRTDRGGYVLDRLKLRLPIFADIWVKFQVAQLCRTLATLLTGGIPLVRALETASGAVRSRLFAEALDDAASRVKEGQTLSAGLAATRLVPPLALDMVEVGEASGALAAMLASVADFFEEEVNTRLSTLVSIIEPLILIFMAIVVFMILLALYLPLFSFSIGSAAH
jgi:type IV pilus assembly protein PilC